MRLLLILVLWQTSLLSHADYNDGEVNSKRANSMEMLRLPEMCQLRFKWGATGKKFAKWKNILGPEYIHVHHYCQGLVALMRLNKRERYWEGVLRSAKGNFNYVLTNTRNPNFILLPDIYYRLALVSIEEGNTGEAINYANKSIQAKQNYLNPYILLADIHIKSRHKSEAKKVLLQAKQYHPNSKKVNNRLKKVK